MRRQPVTTGNMVTGAPQYNPNRLRGNGVGPRLANHFFELLYSVDVLLRGIQASPHGVNRHMGRTQFLPRPCLSLPELWVAVGQVDPGFHANVGRVSPRVAGEIL